MIAAIEVDELRRVNEQVGHLAGDEVLRTIVSVLQSNLGSFDPIVRTGGDEFMCGIGGIDLAAVKRSFDSTGRLLDAEIGVRISVGLVALGSEETLDQLTVRANAALAMAKSRRRQHR